MLRVLARWLHRLLAAGTDQRIDIYYMCEGLLLANQELPRVIDTVSSAAAARRDSSQVAMLRAWQEALANSRLPEEIAFWVPASEAVIFQGYGVGRTAPAELFAGAAKIAALKSQLISEVMKAVAMPVLLGLAMIVMLWMAGGYMLPALAEISDPAAWEPMTAVVAGLAFWINGNTFAVVAIVGSAVAGLWVLTVAWRGPGRTAMDRFPPFSIYKLVTGCSFLIVVLEFLRVGQDTSDRLFHRLEDGSGPYVRSRIAGVRRAMARGENFGRAMRTTGYKFPDAGLIAVAESLDGTTNWHIELGKFMERWVQRSGQTLKSRLGIMRNVMLLMVMMVLGTIINAMFDVMSQVR